MAIGAWLLFTIYTLGYSRVLGDCTHSHDDAENLVLICLLRPLLNDKAHVHRLR